MSYKNCAIWVKMILFTGALFILQVTLGYPDIILEENSFQVISRRTRNQLQIPLYDLNTLKEMYLKWFNLEYELNPARLRPSIANLSEDELDQLIEWAEANLEDTFWGKIIISYYDYKKDLWERYFSTQRRLSKGPFYPVDFLETIFDIPYTGGGFYTHFVTWQEFGGLERRVLDIGYEKNLLAHGINDTHDVNSYSGRMKLLNIILEGKIDSTVSGSLGDNYIGGLQDREAGGAATWGPYYIILDPVVLQELHFDELTGRQIGHLVTSQPIEKKYHLFYLVPGPMEKLYLETGLNEAVSKGIITSSYRDEALKKVLTYEEFIAKFGE